MTDLSIGESERGSVVEVSLGDRVTLRLPENPTTGFRWTLQDDGRGPLVLESDRIESAAGGGIGGGGQRVLVFRAARAGTAELKLRLRRGWEAEGSSAAQYEATIRIR